MVVERCSKYNGCLTSSHTEVGLYEAHAFCCLRKVIGLKREKRFIRCRGVYLNHFVKYKIAHYCRARVCVCVCVYTQKNNLKILYVLVAKMRGISSPTEAPSDSHKFEEWKTNLMSLAILFRFLCAQHVSDINRSINRILRRFYWITTSFASACNTDTTPTQPYRISNTHRTKNNTTNVVIQQNSRKLLMMDILMPETCWAHKKWNKIASDIKLVFYSLTITMMHGPISIRSHKFI